MSSSFILVGSSLYFSRSSVIFGERSCIRFIEEVALFWIGQRASLIKMVRMMIAQAKLWVTRSMAFMAQSRNSETRWNMPKFMTFCWSSPNLPRALKSLGPA
jgi:hypothetical protein